ASAEALAEDLRRYRAGESISARSYNMLAWVTRTLEQSHYDVQFGSWGTMLLWFAVIVGVSQLVSTALLWGRPAHYQTWLLLVYLVKFGLMAALFWRNRAQGILPTTTAERQIWSLWAGYVIAYLLIKLVSRMTASPDYPYDP